VGGEEWCLDALVAMVEGLLLELAVHGPLAGSWHVVKDYQRMAPPHSKSCRAYVVGDVEQAGCPNWRR